MEQVYSGEVKIPQLTKYPPPPHTHILRNPKVGYRTHDSPSLLSANFKVILSWLQRVNICEGLTSPVTSTRKGTL